MTAVDQCALPEVFEHATRPVIACDLDEVLGYFVRNLCLFHNEEYGTALTEANFHSYTFADVWGGTKEESVEKVHKFFESSYFQDGIEAVPGALEALTQLSKHFDLVVVTSRQHSIAEETHRWVETHFPNVFKSILFGNHWGVNGEKRSKPEMCAEIGAEVLIDDALHYARECACHNMNVVLFGDYAWNRTDEALSERIHRVTNWTEAYEAVCELHLAKLPHLTQQATAAIEH
eukprot:m.44117 g.44117  ORF g.44117 m.44117 type:complete len:233 (+) comp10819_c1_seq1:38-736(+)